MNPAEKKLRQLFNFGSVRSDSDVFISSLSTQGDAYAHNHPDVQYALFGPSGQKQLLYGREQFRSFVENCAAALSERSDEIRTITSIGEQCALVHAKAYRKSLATGLSIHYEWAMLYRVENDLITYGSDMLDAAAQEFWAKVLG